MWRRATPPASKRPRSPRKRHPEAAAAEGSHHQQCFVRNDCHPSGAFDSQGTQKLFALQSFQLDFSARVFEHLFTVGGDGLFKPFSCLLFCTAQQGKLSKVEISFASML